MRLGGPLSNPHDSPESWIHMLQAEGYRAASCPLGPEADAETVKAYATAARQADIVIAEVGAWSNPLSPDADTAAAAVEKCQAALDLADRIGACCCVNIAGSCGQQWDGPDERNLTDATFERIVVLVRSIIDTVAPARTFYTLETMPWMYPDSPEAYVRLIQAIDRKAFAVHLDPVNLICSPQRYFANGDLIEACFTQLGEYIKSCHAKDILLGQGLTVHLDEVRPGRGRLDYPVFLRQLNRLHDDVPLMLEHLSGADEYRAAARYIRDVAARQHIVI